MKTIAILLLFISACGSGGSSHSTSNSNSNTPIKKTAKAQPGLDTNSKVKATDTSEKIESLKEKTVKEYSTIDTDADNTNDSSVSDTDFISLNLSYPDNNLFDKESSKSSKIWFNNAVQINVPKLPVKGKTLFALNWRDKSGENFLVLTHTGIVKYITPQCEDEDCTAGELFGYHFRMNNNTMTLVRRFTDGISDCRFDIVLSFIENSITVTDLDKDGLAEFSVLYKTGCRSDVSPANMKLLMFENGDKSALRGTMTFDPKRSDWSKELEDRFGLGKFKTDSSFKTAPEQFLPFAKSRWEKFKIERFY
jgi:hypothetical protein